MAERPKVTSVEVCLDVEDNPLWESYGIEIVPTVLFFSNGEVVRRLDGKPLVGLDLGALDQALVEFDRGRG